LEKRYDERKLVEGLKRKKMWAYEILYDRYAPLVGGIAKSYLGTDDVEDVIQEVFMRVYKGIKKFREDSALSTWIYRIAVNVCKDMISKYKQRRETLTDFEVEEIFHGSHEGKEMLDSVVNDLTMEEIERAMNKLSEEDRLLIKFRDIDGMSYEDISNVMGKPIGTVKSRLHYARKRLKEILEKGVQP